MNHQHTTDERAMYAVTAKDRKDICLVIPTYNNAGTLLHVVGDALASGLQIIVVNDGSTDATEDILARVSNIEVVSYTPNKGKGNALREAFKRAKSMGFRYAITMDSDGQHFASDIPIFLRAVHKHPDAMIVGSRDLESENMPSKNSFANRFSNFWFHLQTLQYLPDTQTGYRLYPLAYLGSLWWVTSRYEAELEILVSLAWKGVKLLPVSIRVYYPPAGERVTHFRPCADFIRISILNTILCILALCYGYPRILFNKLKGAKN